VNAVVKRYVAREAARRHHVVVYLSGAHAYGFPSPDSDFDLKCVHAAPTRDLVGLTPREGGAERIEMVDGVEIDYGSNEIGAVLRGALNGNGNFLERLLGSCVVEEDVARMATLRPIVHAILSRRVHNHYRGFALSQLRGALAHQPPAAKRVLYVLRTALTGVHLLSRAEVVTDLNVLAEAHDFAAARELIEKKQQGERAVLDEATWARWRPELDRALAMLEEAPKSTKLPAEPPEHALVALESWLVKLRGEMF